MVTRTLEIEATPEGTIIEVFEVADKKEPFWPRVWIREWIDERHYRSVEVPPISPLQSDHAGTNPSKAA